VDAPEDPRTLTHWARIDKSSVSAIRSYCQIADVPVRESLVFARLVRAVVRQQKRGIRAQDSLDVIDRRTLHALVEQAGGGPARLPISINDFLVHQTLISCPFALAEVRRVIGGR
jgi:hypothetical protein